MIDERYVYYTIVEKKNGINETIQARNILEKLLRIYNINIPEIKKSSSGKPYFEDSNIFFNYSHSKNYIACAISSCEVGIDIENLSRIICDDVSKKYLDNLKDNNKRIENWVKKESYSKLKGLGLQIKFQNVKLDEIKNKNLFIKTDKYMCSIYSDQENIEFKEIDGSELL